MPRNPRNYIKSEYLHIMVQGINKSYIFNRTEDIKYYIKLMYKILKNYDIKIIAYCIMNNHAHILVKINSIEELSKYMKRLNSTYAMYYNRKYQRVGYLFRDRFKSEIIKDEKHYWTCIKYIYDNPVKAGICRKAEDYKWSNYKPIKRIIKEEMAFIDTEEDYKCNYRNYIKEFLSNNNIKKNELIENKGIMKKLIKTLNNQFNLSIIKISKELNVSKGTAQRLRNKDNKLIEMK